MKWRLVIFGVMWIGAAMAIIGFFLPWARLDAREPSVVKQLSRIAVTVRRGTEVVTGHLPSLSEIPRQISGFQIPQMANQEEAKVGVALVELMTNQREEIGIKSYAVYLLPGAAVLCAVALTIMVQPVAIAVASAILCATVAGVGFWKLLTVNTRTPFVAITIGLGLWLSLWAYVGLAVASGIDAIRRSRHP